MKKNISLKTIVYLLLLFSITSCKDQSKCIYYTTVSGNPLEPTEKFKQIYSIASNEYKDGKGCLELYADLYEIDSKLFQGSHDLQSITLPTSVSIIEAYAFADCENLKTIDFQKNSRLAKIEKFAFANSGLETFHCSNGIGDIEYGAFSNCKKLKEFSGLNATKDGKGIFHLYVTGSKHLIGVAIANEETYTISDEINEICSYTFNGYENLRTVYVPNSVKYIHLNAFHECPSLEMVHLSKDLPGIVDKGKKTSFSFNTNPKLKISLPAPTDKKTLYGWKYTSWYHFIRDKRAYTRDEQ